MSTDSTIALMDLHVNAGGGRSEPVVARTALSHVDQAQLAGRSQWAVSTVELDVSALTGLLVLRVGDAKSGLSSALQKQAFIALPERLQSSESGDYCARWMSPDEWLLSCPLSEAFAVERSLREAVEEADAGAIAIVNVSGGYSRLVLSGDDAINVLRKSTGYDVDPVHFSEGKVVNTTFAKAQATLRALPEGMYEILVRRSFADYLWLWLQRAGKEYGMKVSLPES